MPLGQSGQHKSRALSEDSEGTNLQTKTVIQQVTKSESKDDGFQKPEMGQENKATAFEKSTFATESGEQVKRDVNYGCSSEVYLWIINLSFFFYFRLKGQNLIFRFSGRNNIQHGQEKLTENQSSSLRTVI